MVCMSRIILMYMCECESFKFFVSWRWGLFEALKIVSSSTHCYRMRRLHENVLSFGHSTHTRIMLTSSHTPSRIIDINILSVERIAKAIDIFSCQCNVTPKISIFFVDCSPQKPPMRQVAVVSVLLENQKKNANMLRRSQMIRKSVLIKE